MAKVIEIGGVDSTQYISATKDQTVSGIKTFTESPIVPIPTTDTQVVNKQYVDEAITNAISTALEASY